MSWMILQLVPRRKFEEFCNPRKEESLHTSHHLDVVVAVFKIIYKIVIGLAVIGDAAQYIPQYLL